MRIPRLHVDAALRAGAEILLPEAPAQHVAKVLRMAVGADLILFNGCGGEFSGRIVRCSKSGVSVQVLEHSSVERESPLTIVLAQGIAKGERMDYTIQKAVELGVQRIVPLVSARTVVALDEERGAKRLQHWQRVAVSACEQSGRTRLPQFEPIQKLDRWLGTEPADLRLVCAPGAAARLTDMPAPKQAACLLVGPEGGLEPGEISAAVRAGYRPVSLGPRVLRTETAPLAAIAALQTLWGDLG